MAFKQYKISDMIKRLEEQKGEKGDLLIELSSDEEGNSFHPVGDIIGDDGNVLLPFAEEQGKLTIYPC